MSPPPALPGPTDRPTRRRVLWQLTCAAGALGLPDFAFQGALPGAMAAAGDDAMHGIAMHGAPKHPPGFSHFPYVNPAAPKGGRLTVGTLGTFDSLNPLILRGLPAAGLRDYLYESLLARALDEPFSLYGLIARAITVPADRSAITFHIDPAARFSDGQPLTAADVLHSFHVLKDHGRPNLRTYYAKVTKAETPDPMTVHFTLEGSSDREMPLILGLMPVLPKHRTSAETFERTTLEPPVGSGPYTIASLEPGRSIVYRRNGDYWGAGLGVSRGRNNFDEIRFEYYRDASALFEAFKSGAIDLRAEDDPARWATGYRFPALAEGRVKKTEFPIAVPAGMSSLAFNTRRPPFDDQRVRQALIALFDFPWINRSLYHGLYTRTESFFARSALASTGRAADSTERRLLAPYASRLPTAILEGTYRFPTSDGTGHNRDNQRAALRLLKAAGYGLRESRLVDAKGRQLGFEILVATREQERLVLSFARSLERLGIGARVRQVDSTQYQTRLKTFDFDMVPATWVASLSPGNEQLFRWSSQAASTEGTFNYPGVKEPAVDAMIAALLAADTGEDFTSAVRALDRVLLAGDYVIPLFHLPRQWVAHWAHLKHPETTSLYGYDTDTWWVERN